jgi:cytoplasmic iron level regulating protein YaaA (DUF328/UPF0246 family)
LEIIDDDTQDNTIVSLYGDNVKDVLEKMASVAQASIMDLSDKFFEVVFNKHQSALYKRFMRDMTEDEEAKFDAIIFNLARTAFKETENVDEVKDAIMKFNFKF